MDNEEFPSAVEGSANNVVFGGDIFQREEVIENIFTYHAPEGDQPQKYVKIREAAKAFAYVVHNCCEAGPDRTAAMRHIREAVMTANQSIATHNAQYR